MRHGGGVFLDLWDKYMYQKNDLNHEYRDSRRVELSLS